MVPVLDLPVLAETDRVPVRFPVAPQHLAGVPVHLAPADATVLLFGTFLHDRPRLSGRDGNLRVDLVGVRGEADFGETGHDLPFLDMLLTCSATWSISLTSAMALPLRNPSRLAPSSRVMNRPPLAIRYTVDAFHSACPRSCMPTAILSWVNPPMWGFWVASISRIWSASGV